MKTSSWRIFLGLIAFVLLVGTTDAGRVAASPNRPGPAVAENLAVSVEQVAHGFTEPVGIVFTGAPNDNRMFIVERAGVIKIVEPGSSIPLPTPFLNISDYVDSVSLDEKGLLGLAFDPNYAVNGHFYVYYTTPNFPNTSDYEIHLSRFSVSGDPNVASPAETLVLSIPHPVHQNHNGGDLQFGPDGYLYLAPGDGGSGGDNSQKKDQLLGKILRLNVSGVPTYTIPASNPFTQTAGVRGEIWSYGLRNPWRFSFDMSTGDLYIGDVGESTWEEVDFQPANSAGGQNYGWNCYEGNHPYTAPDAHTNCSLIGPVVWPVAEHDHSQNDDVIVGGYVYRGSRSPQLDGYYIYTDDYLDNVRLPIYGVLRLYNAICGVLLTSHI
jgi:glucose/arabinose dehydrogenase